MPVTSITKLGTEGLLGLWEIADEPEPDFLKSDTYLQAITAPARKTASVAARLLIQALLQQWNEPYYGIGKDEHGQPYLERHPFFVSITHAGAYAAAILHKTHPTGIDLEYKKDKILKVAHRIFTVAELAEAGHDLEKLTLYWSAKEALYKMSEHRELVFREHILIHPFALQPREGTFSATLITNNRQNPHQMHYHRFQDFVLTYTMSEVVQ